MVAHMLLKPCMLTTIYDLILFVDEITAFYA